MPFTDLQQIRPSNDENNESPLSHPGKHLHKIPSSNKNKIPLGKNMHKIRSLRKSRNDRVDKSGLISSSEQKLERTRVCCCCQNTAPKEELTVRTVLEASRPRFGPVHGKDKLFFEAAKKEAWQHILDESIAVAKKEALQPIPDKNPDDGRSSIEKIYLMSIRRIEKEAKATYDSVRVKKIEKRDEFAWMMVKDGCFFLQLALHILGGGDLLGYPADHPFFGEGKEMRDEWMQAMFIAGNQIPSVVIRGLMKQSFFEDVIKKGIKEGTWLRRPEKLPKLVLYLTVVEPELRRIGPNSSGLFSKLMIVKKEAPVFQEDPSDILHGLHCLLLGHENDPSYYETKEFRDVETGREEDRLPSARELIRSGITLKKGEQGIMKTNFWNFSFFAYLYVPPLTIDGDTEVMLRSLMDYEQQLVHAEREVTAYLWFMRDLVQSYKDFKILEAKKIIQVKDSKFTNDILSMLNNLVSSQKSNFTPNLSQTRRKITEYRRPPWRLVSVLITVLTVVQTVLAVLSYVKPLKS